MLLHWKRFGPVLMAEGGGTGDQPPARPGNGGFSADYVARMQADMDRIKDELRQVRATHEAEIARVTAQHNEALAAARGEHEAALAAAAAAHQEAATAAEAAAAERMAAMQEVTRQQAVGAALRAAATAAGMVDADGLKLLDPAEIAKLTVDEAGQVGGVSPLLDGLKKAKPFLFGPQGTSNPSPAPRPAPAGERSVKDMTDAEFRQAMNSRAWRDRPAA